MKAIEKRIAGRLLSNGVLTEAQLHSALQQYDGTVPLSELLQQKGLISAQAACRAGAEAEGNQFVELDDVVAAPEALALMTAAVAWQRRVLPIAVDATSVTLAVESTGDLMFFDNLKLRLKLNVVTVVAEGADLRLALARYYGPDPAERALSRSSREVPLPRLSETPRPTDQQPTVRLEDSSTAGEKPWDARPNMPKVTSGTVVEDLRRKSGSGEISHREFQRRIREMRDSSSGEQQKFPPAAGSQAPTHFLESSDSTLEQLESARLGRGAYEPPTDSKMVEKLTVEAETPALAELRRIIASALDAKADEVEFLPQADSVRIRQRRGGDWFAFPGYPLEHHGQVIGRLRLMAGLELRPRDLALDHQLLIPHQKGQVLATLFLEKTAFGDRAVLRLTENVPLLREPLLDLALPAADLEEITNRLAGRAGGLLLLSAPNARLLAHQYASVIAVLARGGTRDILSLERPNERRIPGVTAISCPNEEILLASLANASFVNPDVLGLQSVENGTVLNRVFNVAIRGTTTIAGLVAADAAMAQGCLHAARIDPMNVLRGLVAHVHMQELSRLCPACRGPILRRDTLPTWAVAIDATFYEARGCERCRQSGHEGSVRLIECHRPATASAEGALTAVVPPDRDVLAYALTGDLDPRLIPLPQLA